MELLRSTERPAVLMLWIVLWLVLLLCVLMLMSCGDAGTNAWDPTETRRGVLLLYKWDKWLRP